LGWAGNEGSLKEFLIRPSNNSISFLSQASNTAAGAMTRLAAIG